MSESPLSLSPDDDQSEVTLAKQPDHAQSIFGAVAVLAGLFVLLLLHGLVLLHYMPHLSMPIEFGLACLGGLLVYAWLRLARPTPPLHTLAGFAAMLGALFALPNQLVYHIAWASTQGLIILIWLLGTITLCGVLLSVWLHVDREPVKIFALNFLLFFVAINLYLMYLVPSP